MKTSTCEVDVPGDTVGSRKGERTGIPRTAPVPTADDDAVRNLAARRALAEALGEPIRVHDLALELEAALYLVGLDVEGGEEAVTQDAELQTVEDPVPPRGPTTRAGGRRCRAAGRGRRRAC